MHKITIAFCETDENYRGRFVTYLMEHKAEEMAVHVFSDVRHFIEEAKRCKFDVILAGSGFFELAQALWERQFPVLYLTEECQQVAEDISFQGKKKEMPRVFRYQNIDAIVHEIIAASQQNMPEKLSELRLLQMEVVGIYSPCAHEMQMPFSLMMAGKRAAEGKKVLYINLMECSGYLELFDLEGERDMGDVLLKLRKHRLVPETFFQCVYQTDEISYIPPFYNPENLRELTREDLEAIIEFIQKTTDFDVLLLDFGGILEKFSKILELCSALYCPMRQGYYYECRKNHFLEYLQETGGESLKQKISFVDLPYTAKGIRGGMDVLRQLTYSDFGDYVRNYLEGYRD